MNDGERQEMQRWRHERRQAKRLVDERQTGVDSDLKDDGKVGVEGDADGRNERGGRVGRRQVERQAEQRRLGREVADDDEGEVEQHARETADQQHRTEHLVPGRDVVDDRQHRHLRHEGMHALVIAKVDHR